MRDRLRRSALLFIAASAAACGSKAPPPAPVAKAAPDDAMLGESFAGFTFGPALQKHKPADAVLEPLAEVGLPRAGRMKAVLATFRDDREPKLQIELWTFDQRGKEDLLEPAGPPQPLLALTAGASSDTDALAELRRDFAAPRTVVGRPQGLGVESANLALSRMHERAQTIRSKNAPGTERVAALAEFVRGLDDDLWLSSKKVPWLLDSLADGPWIEVGEADGTAHRMRLRAKPGEGKPEYSLAFLRKRDGWVLQHLEQRR